MIINRIQVKGAKELNARLTLLPTKVQKSILRPALRAGCKIIQQAAKANAPVRSGAMKRAIKVKSGRGRKGVVVMRVVLGAGFYVGDTFYGSFQEFGWHAGPRRESLKARATRITNKLRAESRSFRQAGTTYGLAKKGTEFRARQEKYFYYQGIKEARKGGKDRRWIEGKHFLEDASKQYGQPAANLSVGLIRAGVIRAATSGIL